MLFFGAGGDESYNFTTGLTFESRRAPAQLVFRLIASVSGVRFLGERQLKSSRYHWKHLRILDLIQSQLVPMEPTAATLISPPRDTACQAQNSFQEIARDFILLEDIHCHDCLDFSASDKL